MSDLVTATADGLYCEAGQFHIDPWRPVPRALITHAHGDHARPGCGIYLTAHDGRGLLRARLGEDARIDTLQYGETRDLNGVHVSFHPAGHVLGSSQIRLEHRGRVWVVSGDYKVTPDPTCQPFEPVACDTFITECTFGLPIYRWSDQAAVFDDINTWWRQNQNEGRASVIFAYSLGKAQRVLAGLDSSLGSIYCHGAVQRLNDVYRQSGIPLPHTEYAGRGEGRKSWDGALILAPPSAAGSPWMRKFGAPATAFVSGWMRIRGIRRRRRVDRGFVLSDHADWPGLIQAIEATGARRILATHGRTGPMVQWLQEQGYDAAPLQTEYVGERDDAEEDAALAAQDASDEEALSPGESS